MNQKGFSRLVLVIIAGVVLVMAGGGFWYYQQSAGPNKESAQKIAVHEMPKLLDIEIKSGVDKEYANRALKGFKIMDFYLNEWFGHSITRKSSIRIEVASEDNKWVVENGTLVYLNRTLSEESQRIEQISKYMDERSRIMAHEYVHLFQFNNGCLYADRAGKTGGKAEEAKWFLEGSAEWLSYKAFDESGNLPFFFSHGWWLSSPIQLWRIGESVKPLPTYDQASGVENVYPYFTLAVDFLMKNRDIKTLEDFCVNLGKGQEVSVAFQNIFGTPLEKFYEEFEAYFTKTFSIPVEKGGALPSGGEDQSQIPQGYSSWEEFCKAQPKDFRCTAYEP